jgi:hypothetical protein
MSPRQRLEALVLQEAQDRGVPFIGTAGSGNALGNADMRMTHDDQYPIRLGGECKDSPTGVRKNHTVPWAEWLKAESQIVRGGAIPVFFTGVQGKGEMAHMKMTDWMDLVGTLFSLSAEVDDINERMGSLTL